MPLYDFECQDCGSTKEYLVLAGKKPRCECGSTKLKKLYSPFSIRMGYPKWVDRMDDHQKRQEDRGVEPTVPHPSKII